jgi:hypothetical protein
MWIKVINSGRLVLGQSLAGMSQDRQDHLAMLIGLATAPTT